jgi:hypothetical protein
MTSQVIGSINKPIVKIVTRATSRGAAGYSAFNVINSLPSFYIDVLIESEKDKIFIITEYKDSPVISRSAGVINRRTPLIVSEIGFKTGEKALLPAS